MSGAAGRRHAGRLVACSHEVKGPQPCTTTHPSELLALVPKTVPEPPR